MKFYIQRNKKVEANEDKSQDHDSDENTEGQDQEIYAKDDKSDGEGSYDEIGLAAESLSQYNVGNALHMYYVPEGAFSDTDAENGKINAYDMNCRYLLRRGLVCNLAHK